MATKQYNTNQLAPNTMLLLRGRLKFGRLTSYIDGEELQRSIQKEISRGSKYPTMVKHTTVTVCDATIVYDNPAMKRIEELFLEEQLYVSKTEGYTGYCFAKVSKGSLPWIGVRNTDGSVTQVVPDGELEANQIVTLVMRVYKTQQNNGVSLDGVIVEDAPIKYFKGMTASNLADKGITFNPLPAGSMPTQPEIVPEAILPPTGNAYSAQPQAPVYQQPQAPVYQQPQAPVYQQPQAQPQAPVYQQPQAQPQAPVYQQPQAQPQNSQLPFSGNQGSESGGIRYNPSENRNY